eukprot:4730900-Alexandrium_andersonii.AAC.1
MAYSSRQLGPAPSAGVTDTTLPGGCSGGQPQPAMPRDPGARPCGHAAVVELAREVVGEAGGRRARHCPRTPA